MWGFDFNVVPILYIYFYFLDIEVKHLHFIYVTFQVFNDFKSYIESSINFKSIFCICGKKVAQIYSLACAYPILSAPFVVLFPLPVL